MMKLKYDEIFETGEESLKSMSYKLDEYLSERSDSRKGLTLRARVSGESADQFNALLKEFVAVDPNQHIHHEDTFHVTILSIVTARPGYVLPEDQVGEYVDVIQQAIRYINPFVISFDGVTASPSCIMVQGFVKDNYSTDGGARKLSKMSSIPEPSNALQDLRHSLRSCFSASDLESTMDQRYTITTAHSTVVRYKTSLQSEAVLDFVLRNRQREMGVICVDELEFVENDWYHTPELTKLLHTFKLS